MLNIVEFKKELFNSDDHSFADRAMLLFNYQAENNDVYREFLQYLDITPSAVRSYSDIPFLPIELFRSRKILTGNVDTEVYFESSGTTSEINSRHYIADNKLYIDSLIRCFELFYGDVKNYCILALLPSYIERQNSSLVAMCNQLIHVSKQTNNGFYLNDWEQLISAIQSNEENNITTLLIGVSFALMEFAEKYSISLKNTIIMETGGMKGRRKEITRQELHAMLKNAFGLNTIHSEYGMTELLSQAYSKKNGLFQTPPWMKVFVRDTEDPFKILAENKTGCLNIIDLANIHSCAFIATHDLGKTNEDGSFEVLGRFDNSEIRGCNLMF